MAPGIDIEQARFNMIEQQIRPWEVLDQHVLELLALVQRELFVPAAHRALAFVDMEIPLPCGQFMLAPKVEARLLQDLALQKSEKVLEVGAGSGHMAALLARRAQSVLTLDIHAELAQLARANLLRAGIHNAQVRQADGSQGAPAEGPFDAIVLSGSVAQAPQHLLAQLKVGGRLSAILGDEPVMRATIWYRTGDTSFETRQRWDTMAPRLLNFPEPARFHF
jgi:protein-L-isoaspartate(D-aspartate) O-methyltransferase